MAAAMLPRMVENGAIAALDAVLEESLKRLKTLGYSLPLVPEVRLDLRGMAAGQALLRRNTVRLNRALLEAEGTDFARETLIHEICHLAVWERHGRRARPHGPQWRQLMRQMGVAPTRCHTAAVTPVRQQRRFAYECGCRQHALTATRHNRARRGTRYVCCACRHELRPAAD